MMKSTDYMTATEVSERMDAFGREILKAYGDECRTLAAIHELFDYAASIQPRKPNQPIESATDD